MGRMTTLDLKRRGDNYMLMAMQLRDENARLRKCLETLKKKVKKNG